MIYYSFIRYDSLSFMHGRDRVERLLFYANSVLAGSVIGMVISVLLAYPLADQLAMAWQITAHIGTVVFALGMKIGYVTRLVFLKRLGRPVH